MSSAILNSFRDQSIDARPRPPRATRMPGFDAGAWFNVSRRKGQDLIDADL
jgi:hypothetical protein